MLEAVKRRIGYKTVMMVEMGVRETWRVDDCDVDSMRYDWWKCRFDGISATDVLIRKARANAVPGLSYSQFIRRYGNIKEASYTIYVGLLSPSYKKRRC